MIDRKKTTQDILQEEMLRERAAVLARAGEKMDGAFAMLQALEREIDAMEAALRAGDEPASAIRQVEPGGSTGREGGPPAGKASAGKKDPLRLFRGELNGRIRAYNRQRDHALLCYYHLIVTREALGLIHHQRLEEMYRIPPKKHFLPEG